MKKIIVGNLKANMNMDRVGDYIYNIKSSLNENGEIIFCPSYIYIPFFTSAGFCVGSQDVSIYENGSYTGEISAEQLKSAGVKYSIVGHSERISHNNETDAIINKKVKQCINNDIIPIICVGETKKEKIEFKTKQVIRMYLLEVLKDLDRDKIKNLIIAYEPIWSIGTGIIPSLKEIDEIALFIKDIVKSAYKLDVKVLYGGSINYSNVSKLRDLENVDGFLIGGASNNTLEFSEIIKEINQ